MNIIETNMYVKASVDKNQNKFWSYKIFDDFTVLIEFGRTGKTRQQKEYKFSNEAECRRLVDKKKSEKVGERKGYVLLEVINSTATIENKKSNVDLFDLTLKQLEYNDKDKPQIEILIKYLINKNIHIITDNTTIKYNTTTGLFETPCGIVTQNVINDARKLLIDIGDYVNKKQFLCDEYKNLINSYLMKIPQNVGMKLDIETLYKNQEDIQKQYDILDSLEVSLDNINKQSVIDDNKDVVEEKRIFNVKMNIVEDMNIFNKINKYFEMSSKHYHACSHLKLKTVYDININDMATNYISKGQVIGNIKSLWHGTKASNILSILKNGLIIPPQNASYCTGRLFGSGIYFASESTKSLNYSYGYWSGSRENKCYMFLADVALGTCYHPRTYGISNSCDYKIYNSIWAKSAMTGLMNDEYIIPNVYQCNLKYLCEFAS